MLKNVGSMDRLARMFVGAALVVAALLGIIGGWGWLGLLPLLTGVIGICPAYLPFRLSTCSMRSPRRGR